MMLFITALLHMKLKRARGCTLIRITPRTCKRVREVIKQLKEKNIKAQSPYPAQLKLFLATGVRVFPTLVEAQSTLKELGVDARIEERDILESELTQDKWSTQENRRRNQMQLNPTDRKYMKTKRDAMFWWWGQLGM
ncbi:hypothetical protein KUCAC02_014066 [Chaenocephalus aceratus]|uniref:Uncharacterized protein n=1 Tax=Chaenocephalus aceratus TaxID=36190 RepID=A0ACB9WCX1_CHAAC|nr:hypothetical protein KUCAC02_014066 [Chaenocephalus aceratus]